MNENEASRWSTTRQRGKGRFILLTILRAGVPYGLFVLILHARGSGLGELFFFFVFGSLLFGLLIGMYLWWKLERAYEKYGRQYSQAEAMVVDKAAARYEEELQLEGNRERWRHLDRVIGPLVGAVVLLGTLSLALWAGPCSQRY
jgi:hypothetical protein